MSNSVSINGWSELAVVEELLSRYVLEKGTRATFYGAARSLLDRVRPALAEATMNL